MALSGLIADIGATNARFALVGETGVFHEQILKCRDYQNLASAARAYIAGQGKDVDDITSAAIAVAGPITGDQFAMTNNPWAFSWEETRKALSLNQLHKFNDFEAVAMAVPHLKAPTDYRKIGNGLAPKEHAPIGVIGPGTGLGVSYLVWGGNGYIPVAAEGGHVTIPAKTQREFDLFRYLISEKYSHVSAERVCSGKGLVNIYNGLRGMDKRADLPDLTPREITQNAVAQNCDLCVETLDMMLGFLGRVAGNLALTVGALGGIYIAGGIPGHLGDDFDRSRFIAEFTDKGRFSDYMADIPTYLITNEFPAFVGLHADIIKTK
jgi:glucokinase